VELDPMLLCAALVDRRAADLVKQYRNFVNGNFFWWKGNGIYTIGWVYSKGNPLNRRVTDSPVRHGTFMVCRDGQVRAGAFTDRQMEQMEKELWFCCQGFNLYPLDIAGEGFTEDVGRSSWRLSIGYNAVKGRVVIAVRPNSDAQRAVKTMNSLGCEGCAICLDSGSSVNLVVDGRVKRMTDRTLDNIIFW